MALSNLFSVFPAGSFSNSFLKVFRCVQLRQLNLQEYASKKLLAHYGINIQKFDVATTPKEAAKIGRSLMADTADELVIKAQILAGGRGKGVFENGFKGGVKLTKDVNTVEDIASKMLGFRLTTKQTPPNGVLVKKLMVCESLTITRETYIAILMDREANGSVIVASPEGGVDIEEVAEKNPSKILKENIDIEKGVTLEQADRISTFLNFQGKKHTQASLQIRRLYNLFNGVDAVQVEINPFGETDKDEVVCFDAKINFDDNAKFRQKAIFEMDDHSEADPRELEADKYNLNYIPLDGNIACMVNGAGLAMATMDIIKLNGGWPANFLDLGGGVTENGVYHGFKLLTSDPQVRCILVNIFGGIVDCAVIARGITKAYQSMNLSVPVVVRLEGTNVDEAKRILTESQMPIKTAENLDDAAKKAVASF
ncbi:succinate--CoA ligase [GDP-forming] subunit beta, mitochondrial isoform X1 [Hydra vulgaris]|uniref:succinate--CoA ligase [GDP-forming] subunit beta, mitochondrial isoform X1 n=1 Tax=Hydra vulgaris TaxID=6087 RepID=UPI00019263A8|nr:succinate--CoA ligase [GDP-forming] subunit beta, mitochondrial [Hydra vulgaris]